jgi:hypothetical protein
MLNGKEREPIKKFNKMIKRKNIFGFMEASVNENIKFALIAFPSKDFIY